MRHISPAPSGRERRRRRIRGKVHGTAERPRLSVFRSNARIYAQVIDDTKGHTLAAAGSTEQALRDAGFPVPDDRLVGTERVSGIQCLDLEGDLYMPGAGS